MILNKVSNNSIIDILFIIISTCAVSSYIGGPVVYGFIVLYSLYVVLLKDNELKSTNYLCLSIFIIAFISILVNFKDIEPVFRPGERIIMLLIVMLAFSPIINSKTTFLYRKKTFLYFTVGLIIMAVASAILAFTGFGYVNGILLGLSDWPNSLGYALGISIITMLIGLKSSNWIIKICCLVGIGLCIVKIPETGTRTSWYSLPVIFLIYIFFNSESIKTMLAKFLLMSVALILLFALFKPDLSLIEAKNELARKRGEHSRESLFEARFKEFKSSPIIGVGTFRCLTQYQKVDTNGHVESGNSFLMFLSMNGIIGFVVFICFYIHTMSGFIKYIYIKRKSELSTFEQNISLVLVFNFIYMLQAGTLLNPGFYLTGFNWLSLSIAYMHPRYCKICNDKENEINKLSN